MNRHYPGAFSDKDQASPEPGQQAVTFLELLRPGGPWLLNSFDPETGNGDTIHTSDTDEVRKFVARHNGKQNIYFGVNPTRGPMKKKAAKVDISAIEYALADCDPADNETPDEARNRYLEAIKATGTPEPTFTISSGNGLQFLWRLETPIPIAEPITKPKRNKDGVSISKLALSDEAQAVVDDVEGRFEMVMLSLGTKAGTQNIDRVLRLPGTLNLPTKKKLKNGRVICQASLIAMNECAYSLDVFPEKKVNEKPKSLSGDFLNRMNHL